jgi:hypothetical protein
MSELLQIPVERDASLSDLAADIFGSVGSLGIAASVPGLGFARLQKRLLAAGVGTMLLVYALAPFLTVSAAYLQRDRLSGYSLHGCVSQVSARNARANRSKRRRRSPVDR